MCQTELCMMLQEVCPQGQLFSPPRNYSNPLDSDRNHWYSENFFLWFVWGFLAYNGTDRIGYLDQQLSKLVSVAQLHLRS